MLLYWSFSYKYFFKTSLTFPNNGTTLCFPPLPFIRTDDKSSLKSPLVGTAYLCPEPGSKAFIEVGQNVKIGQVLLIIEAMKTMNEITADRNGIIKEIYVKNESPVEFGEPLVLIE